MKSIHSIALCCYVIIIYACSHKMISSSPVNMNQEIKDYRGNTILIGKSTRERLEQPPYDSWFNQNYKEYVIDTATAMQILGNFENGKFRNFPIPKFQNKKRSLNNVRFLLFMGTWCGDSRREVPRIYKLLDYCGISPAQVQLINLNNQGTEYKQSPTHEEKGLHIIRVPTLLIMTHNKETGRIVETPVVSWEKDLLAILSGKAYEPRYSTGSDKRQAISIH